MTNHIEFCEFCGSSDCRNVTTDKIDNNICEYDIVCNNCDKTINMWGFGFFHNEKSSNYLKMEIQRERKNKLKKLNRCHLNI
jgi:hypothetical protein